MTTLNAIALGFACGGIGFLWGMLFGISITRRS